MEQDKETVKDRVDSNTNGDGVALRGTIVRFFHSHFSEVLNILSSRFPHVKGDGSINEKEFNGLRAKVLRSGNNQIRNLDTELSDYEIRKVRHTEVKIMPISTKVITKEKENKETKNG